MAHKVILIADPGIDSAFAVAKDRAPLLTVVAPVYVLAAVSVRLPEPTFVKPPVPLRIPKKVVDLLLDPTEIVTGLGVVALSVSVSVKMLVPAAPPASAPKLNVPPKPLWNARPLAAVMFTVLF